MEGEASLRHLYPTQWTLVRQFMANASDDSCESFLFSVMPKLKEHPDLSNYYRIVKEELVGQFGQESMPTTSGIQLFCEQLLQVNRESERDPISEKWNLRFRILGFLAIAINVGYVIHLLLTSTGYSMGPVFQLISFAIWLSPSILGLYAIRRDQRAFFGTWQAILLIVLAVFIFVFGYWLLNDLLEFIKLP
ncbi:MAG: hypothetical protein IPN38_03185 [Flavobacteriales bacterium]|nr:hypothetical protein [Flavobacteriales bacterium]